jgi:hypothetical protein
MVVWCVTLGNRRHTILEHFSAAWPPHACMAWHVCCVCGLVVRRAVKVAVGAVVVGVLSGGSNGMVFGWDGHAHVTPRYLAFAYLSYPADRTVCVLGGIPRDAVRWERRGADPARLRGIAALETWGDRECRAGVAVTCFAVADCCI